MTDAKINFNYHILGDEMTYDEAGHAYRHDLPLGAAQWVPNHHDNEKHTALVYVCACGCGAVGCAPVNKGVKVPLAWLWDGNIESPTLTPSILKTFGCRWHGFLTAGVFKSV